MKMNLLHQSFCVPLQGKGGFPYFSRRWVEGVPSLTEEVTQNCYLVTCFQGCHYDDANHYSMAAVAAKPFGIFLAGGDDSNMMLRFADYDQLDYFVELLKANPDAIGIARHFN